MKICEIVVPKTFLKKYKKEIPARPLTAEISVYNGEEAFNKHSEEWDKFRKNLQSNGWFRIGEGYYSDIFGNKNKNYVLKANTTPDQQYDRFTRFCKKEHSIYLPKIIDRKFISKNGNTYYVYLIEKLYKSSKDISKIIISIFKDIIENNADESHIREKYNKFFKKYPGLYEMIKKIILVNPKNIDMTNMGNKDNIMVRKDGTPVLIDPYSSFYS